VLQGNWSHSNYFKFAINVEKVSGPITKKKLSKSPLCVSDLFGFSVYKVSRDECD